MGFFSKLFKIKKTPAEVKVGLALGSGGAKGFAELGAMRAFEENDIRFDCFAGTSIGSILGAFFADGYTSTDVRELLRGVDFNEIKNLFMINMSTAGLFGVIDRFIGSLTFEELKKPFKAVATNVDTGEEKVFDSGSVAQALCASSAMPPFFKPVVIGDKRYIDGAFVNSVPADEVKNMGADFIVGIDLSDHAVKPAGLLARIFPTYQSKVKEPWKIGYDQSDVMIHPDLTGYKAISFGAMHEMYDIGYNAAMLKVPEILKRIEELKKIKK